MDEKDQTPPVTIRAQVTKDLRQQLKVRAAEDGTTANAIIVKALEYYLSKEHQNVSA